MSGRAYWLQEPYMISADYEGQLTVEDFEVIMRFCLDALQKQMVYFVVDVSTTTSSPMNVALIPSVRALITHPNTGAFAWVGASRFVRVMVPTVIRKPSRFFDNRAEAIAYLEKRREIDLSHQGMVGPNPIGVLPPT
jgi:hypothetical protein